MLSTFRVLDGSGWWHYYHLYKVVGKCVCIFFLFQPTNQTTYKKNMASHLLYLVVHLETWLTFLTVFYVHFFFAMRGPV